MRTAAFDNCYLVNDTIPVLLLNLSKMLSVFPEIIIVLTADLGPPLTDFVHNR